MKTRNLIFVFSLYAAMNVSAQHIDAGISIGGGGVNSFYLSIGNYFRVPEREVVVVRERRIPDEEIPVVFYIAQRARVPYREIIGCRQRGMSWMDITYHYNLGPDIYFPGEVQGPPYGKAWGHRKKERAAYRDYEIVNAVNSRFMSDYHHCSPDEIRHLRGQGVSYVQINDRYVGKKKDHGHGRENVIKGNPHVQEFNQGFEHGKSKDHGNGNGHGNGHGRGHGRD
ncbi:MAG: hypothetical protein HF314_01675 [Ignavibacteria bacterium]|jgi:hypothetical protein|nr:hypothetical protein [Ignavibacteria bacterium]MCU7501752.1 hypothetical protein [Ignavibacteria bacterium]MCU7516841.1 hypothetical protein [Ignavibacteria bacterium]